MPLRLGIDIACRAAHQVSLADEQGRFIWTGRRFRTTPQDLIRLWAMLPEGTDPADVLVVMEPTRNAWVPLSAWFRRHGAEVVLVPPERTADLRRYHSKHSKTDRLDSQLLAMLPTLHPDGLYAERGLGPSDALKRAAKLHSTLTHRRSQSLARLDALMEILGPAWHAAIGADLANRTPLKFLAAGYADPYVVERLGRTRLARFCCRHSRGAWGEPHADALLAAASVRVEQGAEQQPPNHDGMRLAGVQRWVDQRGAIRLAGFSYRVPVVLTGEPVGAVVADNLVQVYHREVLVASHVQRRQPDKEPGPPVQRRRSARKSTTGPDGDPDRGQHRLGVLRRHDVPGRERLGRQDVAGRHRGVLGAAGLPGNHRAGPPDPPRPGQGTRRVRDPPWSSPQAAT